MSGEDQAMYSKTSFWKNKGDIEKETFRLQSFLPVVCLWLFPEMAAAVIAST